MDKQKTLARWTYLVIVLGLLFNVLVYFKYHVPIVPYKYMKGVSTSEWLSFLFIEVNLFIMCCAPFFLLWFATVDFNKKFGSFRVSLSMLIFSIVVVISGVAMFIPFYYGSSNHSITFSQIVSVYMLQVFETGLVLVIIALVCSFNKFSKAGGYEYQWEGHTIRYEAVVSHKTLWLYSHDELWVDGKLCARTGGIHLSGGKASCQIEHAGNPVTIAMMTKTYWKGDMGMKYRLLIQGIEVDSGIMQMMLRL
ncbi:hypothetical protein LLG96_06850 [bacterium]|nr:hypothetical protein [bacterium]